MESDDIKRVFEKLTKPKSNYSLICQVTKISDNLCICKPIDDTADFVNVKLNAGESGFLDTIIIPELNSYVIISFLDKCNAYISQYSKIDKILNKSNKIIFDCVDLNLGGENGEKAIKGETFNSLLSEIITCFQTFNTALIAYGTAQAAEFPAIAASNGALVSSLSSQITTISSWTAKLQQHLSNNVRIN